jgi:periplasmic divalent cation tolerance protein
VLEVHVTFPNPAEAYAVSRRAVDQRLAACANILPAMRSFYWWDGAVQSAEEVAVVFKTSEQRADALIAFVAAAHSYEVPAIVVHRPQSAAVSYEEWVDRETTGGGTSVKEKA